MQPDSYYPNQPPNPYPQQQVMPVSSDEVYASELQREVVKNIVHQLDPENQMQVIEMRLRGYRKDNLTQQWVKINPKKPEPPAEMIDRYMSALTPIVSQGTTMAFLSERQVNMMMSGLIEWLADDMDNNAEAYGFENDFTERTRIGNIILDSAFTALTRAINGRESQRIFKAISLSEYSSPGGEQKQKKGILDYLKM